MNADSAAVGSAGQAGGVLGRAGVSTGEAETNRLGAGSVAAKAGGGVSAVGAWFASVVAKLESC